ncbi:putative T7SS-secreted protein [Miniimonas sp. S16]|uniref:putative T7SS-secreted protein n=1 Tax=Miniimonas sp. S16 TaxID=2171623 RepID=UPI000D529E5D|nr:polymorphic toxin type 28 domain-containing protein [Miniimonas sp. S16]
MTELGETSDPAALVPGNVGTLADRVWALRGFSESLEDAFTGLKGITTDAGWSGEAADAFRTTYHAQTSRWSDASVAFEDAASAVDSYTNTLQWAQGKARDAIARYAEGDALTDAAITRYNDGVDRYNRDLAEAQRTGGTAPTPLPPFSDPGEAVRAEARETLQGARESLVRAGDTAAASVRAALADAPEEPSWLDKAGDALGDAATWLGERAYDVSAAVVNSVASFGNAMIEHPGETAAFLGGIALMVLGGTGEVGGVALDATGVGALAGVPINIAAAGVIAAGATMTAAATTSLAQHAGSDSRVEVMESRASESGPATKGERGTPTDRQKEHLTERDLDAARRERAGEVVARKSDGTPWDHVQEVRNAQQGLWNRIAKLKRMLGDSRLSPEARQAAQEELSEASRLFDHSKGYLPWP